MGVLILTTIIDGTQKNGLEKWMIRLLVGMLVGLGFALQYNRQYAFVALGIVGFILLVFLVERWINGIGSRIPDYDQPTKKLTLRRRNQT